MTKQKYPVRHWSIVGYPGSGKSTFAARMHGPKLIIDADHRFQEVLELNNDTVYQLSDSKSDNVDPDRISKQMSDNMPGSDIKTIVVDSLTAIITPITIKALIDKDKGRTKNLMSGFKDKALAMRQLIDAVTRWGTDCLWIYHLHDARDARANEVTTTTISDTETARLLRCINVQLELIETDNKRGVKILWARQGKFGMTLYDDTGNWQGMPEKIESAVYDGLTEKQQQQIKNKQEIIFTSPQHAQSYAVDKGAYANVDEARQAYGMIKEHFKPDTAKAMSHYWMAEIRNRIKLI